MVCKNCGYNLEMDEVYCPSCGTRLKEERNNDELFKSLTNNSNTKTRKPKARVKYASDYSPCRSAFAIIGFILSLFSMLVFAAFLANLFIIIPALVFSVLGVKSETKGGFGIAGVALSLLAFILSVLFFINIF